METFGKLLLGGLGIAVGWKVIDLLRETEADRYAKWAEEMDHAAQQALFAKSYEEPFALTQSEIKILGSLPGGPERLGEMMSAMTQEDRARFQARATGQAYNTPDAPGLAQTGVDPSFVGPPVPEMVGPPVPDAVG